MEENEIVEVIEEISFQATLHSLINIRHIKAGLHLEEDSEAISTALGLLHVTLDPENVAMAGTELLGLSTKLRGDE